MDNRTQVLNGYFYECEYYEWDDKNKVHKDPIKIRYKQNDEGTQGVSSGGRETKMIQTSQGRMDTKDLFTIKVIDDLPYKPLDLIKTLNDGKYYIFKQKFTDERTTNSIKQLRFKKDTSNKQFVLVLGER